MRIILENVGLGLAVALLWFNLIPILVSGGIGIQYRQGFGFGLLASTIAVLAVVLWLAFRVIHVTEPTPLFIWHTVAFLLSYAAVHVTTNGRANPISILALVVVLVAGVSHAIGAITLLPAVFGAK